MFEDANKESLQFIVTCSNRSCIKKLINNIQLKGLGMIIEKEKIFIVLTISHVSSGRVAKDFLGDLPLLSVCTSFEPISIGAWRSKHHNFKH